MKTVPDLPGIVRKESGGMPQTSSLAIYFSPMTDEVHYGSPQAQAPHHVIERLTPLAGSNGFLLVAL